MPHWRRCQECHSQDEKAHCEGRDAGKKSGLTFAIDRRRPSAPKHPSVVLNALICVTWRIGASAELDQRRGMSSRSLAFAVLLMTMLAITTAQEPRGEIFLNDSVSGTTLGVSTGTYTSFATVDIGGAGQVYYVGTVPGETAWDVTFSTCAATTFDTYIVVFSGKLPISDNVLAESNNDSSCFEDVLRSRASLRLQPGPYAVLVTGVGLAQGTFTLESKAQNPYVTETLPWGLDRIDQRQLPLDGIYKVPEQGNNGAGITVYVLDSGVRATHDEFEDRVTEGFDFVSHSTSVTDCTGFGTSAAGVIAGKKYGVAKAAKIVSVRILDCDNKAQISHVTSALEWVILNVQFQPSRQVPAIIFMRFHSGENEEIDNAVASVTKFGIPVIAPAGDLSNGDYCSQTSPATSEAAIMVGSTDRDDYRSSFSNYGSCTSLFAPGNNITSASFTSDTAADPSSGTAIAAAHVAGATALLLDMNTAATPRDLGSILASLGTVGVVKNGTGAEVVEDNEDSSTSSPRLAFVRSLPNIFGETSSIDMPAVSTLYMYYMVNYTNVLGAATDVCSGDVLKPKMATAIGVDGRDLFSLCSGESAVYRVTAGERQAATVSSQVQAALGENRQESENTLGTEFDVIEKPWFVDSQGFTYWSEPQFEKADKSLLTVGAIVGIVVGALLVLIVLAVFGYATIRYLRGVDDVESMEGSADFERGPTHFNDFSGNNGARESNAKMVARSFRNVFDGIGRSLSMRGGGGGFIRQGSKRGGGPEGGDGISRMDSYMGQVRGADQGGGTDIMRMKSYGAEAFAGLGAVSRSNSMRSVGSSAGEGRGSGGFNGDQRIASFRVAGKKTGLSSSRQSTDFGIERLDSEGGDSMSDVRMHSMGGEAFAMLTRELSEIGRNAKGSAVRGSGGSGKPYSAKGSSGEQPKGESSSSNLGTETASYGAEALAPPSDEPGREPSFFNASERL